MNYFNFILFSILQNFQLLTSFSIWLSIKCVKKKNKPNPTIFSVFPTSDQKLESEKKVYFRRILYYLSLLGCLINAWLSLTPCIQISWWSRTLKNKSLTQPLASLVAQVVKNLSAMQETLVWFLGREDPL